MFAVWLCVFLCTIPPGEGYVNALKYKKQWAGCSSEEPFLILRNIAMDKCVSECNIRTACRAVNYWTRRLQCDMLLNDTESPIQDGNNTQPCVFVKKADFDPAYEQSLRNCKSCNDTTACDVGSGQCEVKECRKLHIPNATIKGNILSVGSKIRINCDRWFTQDPPETLSVCLGNGTWNNTPTCSFPFDCKTPPAYPHMEIHNILNDSQTGLPSHVLYKCVHGYATDNSTIPMTIACLNDTGNPTWDQPMFNCLRDCHLPAVIGNARISPGHNLENMTKTYSCLPGYVMHENMTANTTCQPNGDWSTVDFECILVCGTIPVVANATVVNGNDSVLNYNCDKGFYGPPTYSTSAVCIDGAWQGPDFVCLPGCAEPTVVENATLLGSGNSVNATRTFHCYMGYANQGKSNISTVCQSNGIWSVDNISCVQVCGSIPAVPNAVVANFVGDIGVQKLEYACEQGYAARNTTGSVVQCITDAWEIPHLSCLRECAEPAVMENSTLSDSDNLEGAVRNYTCIPDHVAINVSSMSIECQSNGVWTSAGFQCVHTSSPASVCDFDKYLVTGPDGVEDSQLSASSFYCFDSGTICPDCLKPKYVRLNSTGGCGSWTPATQSSTDYIQVDFLTTKQTTGIVITGRAKPSKIQYVTAFKVLYSLDCVTFNHVQDGSGNDKMFAGSSNEVEVVTRCFDQPIPARCLKINPTAYVFYPYLRFDVLGY